MFFRFDNLFESFDFCVYPLKLTKDIVANIDNIVITIISSTSVNP